MMNQAELRTEWIRRLRSGEYKQTQGILHRSQVSDNGRPVGHCCLGIACEILVEEGLLTRNVVPDGDRTRFNTETTVLPTSAIQALGMLDRNGTAKQGILAGRSLTELNDASQATFSEIADALETGDYWTS